MAEKVLYSMGDVAELFDVNQSLIRHWQRNFPQLIRPERNKKGNRLFSPEDVENLKLIYHLIRERGLTLEGAKKAMKQQRAEHRGMPREVELTERLQRIRALLVEVREELKVDEGEVFADETATSDPADIAERKVSTTASRSPKPAVQIAAPVEAVEAEAERSQEGGADRTRQPRRKQEGDEQELFAFYEQSLF